MAKPVKLRFGIPSFDGLFNSDDLDRSWAGRQFINPQYSDCGISITNGSASICLLGPDGVGKSVFAMHLASRYMAESLENNDIPRILYVSTDLNFEMAAEMWKNFSLDRPAKARSPFCTDSGTRFDGEIRLQPAYPESLPDILVSPPTPAVTFVDLASKTAGDDWSFINRLASQLDECPTDTSKHLLIIDAVEGLETYVGELDAFGEHASRRSRIAQLMRLLKAKSHVLFVIEEGAPNIRLPEQFVTDVVIRLSKKQIRDYTRRTLEIEKARGQSYARGEHQYSIRHGNGSSTGTQANPDDPRFPVSGNVQSYVHVTPSLANFNRTIMERRGYGKENPPANQFACFGIEHLDNMLGGEGDQIVRAGGYDSRGLPAGTITTLIGDSFTQKTRLGRAFLSQSFGSVVAIIRELVGSENDEIIGRKLLKRMFVAAGCPLKSGSPFTASQQEILNRIVARDWAQAWNYFFAEVETNAKFPSASAKRKHIVKLRYLSKTDVGFDEFFRWLAAEESGVAVLITTFDTNVRDLVDSFVGWLAPTSTPLAPFEKALLRGFMEDHIICRRLEIQDISSSVMFNIFTKAVWKAQTLLLTEPELSDSDFSKDRLARIRVVVDDFNILREIQPDFIEDPLLLPSLRFMLGRIGVTTLILDTQTGKPDLAVVDRFANELREIADNRLYTWRVRFFGENRVAIASIPPLSLDHAGIVRELRWQATQEGDPLVVDPHFELYMHIEEGVPCPVPLEVRFFDDVPTFSPYIDEENKLLRELFVPYHREGESGFPEILRTFPATDYDFMRNSSTLQRDTRLEHTMLLRVDEFWGPKLPDRRRSGSYRPQWGYLDSITRDERGAKKDIDPYLLFQHGANDRRDSEPIRKREFFDNSIGYQIGDRRIHKEERASLERIPFTWDFGFLLCKKQAWNNAKGKKLDTTHRRGTITVEQVWNDLLRLPRSKGDIQRPVTWRDFLDACKNVAESESVRLEKPVVAFDTALMTPETFSCFFLEIWVSEIFDRIRTRDGKDKSLEFANSLSKRKWAKKTGAGLLDWLDPDTGFVTELYKTWLLLLDVMDFGSIAGTVGSDDFEFPQRVASAESIASRHWYKTACQWVNDNPKESVQAVRLPGHFTVRGDWFLAVAGGSRSGRLADRALDILSSKRANIVRLQSGVGLPTRRLKNTRQLRTCLTLSGEFDRPMRIEYQNLRSIGSDNRDFQWLWRSNIGEYHRHCRIWHKWLNRMMHWWAMKRLEFAASWASGFRVYDLLNSGAGKVDGEQEIQEEFRRMCALLSSECEEARLNS